MPFFNSFRVVSHLSQSNTAPLGAQILADMVYFVKFLARKASDRSPLLVISWLGTGNSFRSFVETTKPCFTPPGIRSVMSGLASLKVNSSTAVLSMVRTDTLGMGGSLQVHADSSCLHKLSCRTIHTRSQELIKQYHVIFRCQLVPWVLSDGLPRDISDNTTQVALTTSGARTVHTMP